MTVAFVLVHSPFVGPSTWDAVAAAVRERGSTAIVPSLVDASTGPPPHWPGQREAVVAAVAELDQPLLLVGHSGAGPLLPAIGEALGQVALGRVAGYVFVDAGLPQPGGRRLDLIPAPFVEQLRALRDADGFLPPWRAWFPGLDIPLTDDRRLPWTLLTEELPAAAGWPDAPCGYVRMSPPYDGDAAEARRLGWPVADIDGHHLSQMTDPDTVMAGIMLVAAAGGVATV